MTAHAFAPIAPAPYSLVSVTRSADEARAGRPVVDTVCEHCGSAISNVAVFRGANGREFNVGLDCAKKANESVTAHKAAAKRAALMASATDVMKRYAGDFSLLRSQGAYLDESYGKPAAALVRAFKPFAKIGLCVIAREDNQFGQQVSVRVIFTAAGAAEFGKTATRIPLVAGEVPSDKGWKVIAG